MTLSQTPRRSTRTSRLGLAVAALAAAGTFAAAIAVTGFPAALVANASASVPTSTEVLADPTTGERVVVDTVYIVTPAPALAVAPAERHEGDDEHDSDGEHEGGEGHETEGGDD